VREMIQQTGERLLRIPMCEGLPEDEQ